MPDPRSTLRPWRFHLQIAVPLGCLMLFGVLGAVQAPVLERAPADPHASHGAHEMSDEEMQRWVDDWFSRNPVVGEYNPAATASVVFRSINGKFDADGDFNGTPIDTVVIGIGETVEWQRLIGTHTVTNGEDSTDPSVGTMFDVPHDASSPVFNFTFNLDGTFPFFCRPHESVLMQGVVIVVGPTPTHSTTWGELKAKHHHHPPAPPAR